MNEGSIYFLVPVIIVAIIFIIRTFKKNRIEQEPHEDRNMPSNYESNIGNQWKQIPKEIDLSDWEEIYSVKQHEHHASRMSPSIQATDKINSIENQEISIFEIC